MLSTSSADISSDPAAATQAVAAAMQQLKSQLMQAAVEAQAFAEQQQADVERTKRSSRQVCDDVFVTAGQSSQLPGEQQCDP